MDSVCNNLMLARKDEPTGAIVKEKFVTSITNHFLLHRGILTFYSVNQVKRLSG